MRKSLVKCVVGSSILLTVLLVLSCGPAAPVSPPATKPMELKLANFLPPKHVATVGAVDPFAEEVNKRTGGKVKVTVYSGEALGKAVASYDMVRTGAVDMAYFPPSYNPGIFPLSDIVSLPFAFRSATTGGRAAWDLHKKGRFDKEYAAVKLLGLGVAAPYAMFSKKKVSSLEDLKGMKVRVSGALEGPAVAALGAVPVTVPYGELYFALERGVADVGTTSMSGGVAIKLQEISKYALDAGYSTIMLVLVMNKDVWQKLPKDVQKVMEEVGGQMPAWIGKAYDDGDAGAKETFRKAGAEVHALSPAERERWVKAVKPVWDNWVVDMEKKGLPGKEIVKDFLALLKKYG